jgi:hypothetical protein
MNDVTSMTGGRRDEDVPPPPDDRTNPPSGPAPPLPPAAVQRPVVGIARTFDEVAAVIPGGVSPAVAAHVDAAGAGDRTTVHSDARISTIPAAAHRPGCSLVRSTPRAMPNTGVRNVHAAS